MSKSKNKFFITIDSVFLFFIGFIHLKLTKTEIEERGADTGFFGGGWGTDSTHAKNKSVFFVN